LAGIWVGAQLSNVLTAVGPEEKNFPAIFSPVYSVDIMADNLVRGGLPAANINRGDLLVSSHRPEGQPQDFVPPALG